jgi:hypothetical protein
MAEIAFITFELLLAADTWARQLTAGATQLGDLASS